MRYALTLVVLCFGCHLFGAAPDALLTNGRANPLGIGKTDLSFSWENRSEPSASGQFAYQVRLFEETSERPLWDSGKVTSSAQAGVALPPEVALRSATRYRWDVRTWLSPQEPQAWSEPSTFETGIETAADWCGAKWIRSAEKETAALPVLSRTFTLRGTVSRARVYATAKGLYQLRLDGNKVGDQFLSPGWTDYRKRIQVQTYDVTAALASGAHTLSVALADGWYRGKVGLGWHHVYGTKLGLLLRLHVDYVDGSTEDLVTDGQWTSAPGPFLAADLQDGEHYDARAEATWLGKPDAPGIAVRGVVEEQPDYAVLVPQRDDPVRVLQRLRPVALTPLSPTSCRVDLGQNMVGVVNVHLTGRAGETVTLRYAEEVHRQGPQKGELYRDNLRGARAEDHYTFSEDGSVDYQPQFTQHGFRYVELSGLSTPLASGDVEGVVLGSDLRRIGTLDTSDPGLNKLISNIRWGQQGNFVSIPTDTPARDERLGWTGDIAVFAPAACWMTDPRAFLSKWLDDVKDIQKVDGNIPAVVPQPRGEFDETGVGWADALIAVPHAVWRSSGDTAFLRRHWPEIRKMYSFIRDSATRDGDYLEQGRASWFSGDWLSLEKVERLDEHPVIATAYLSLDSGQMSDLARALGDEALARECEAVREKANDAFARAYVGADGSVRTETQTVYAMALGMGLIKDAGLRAKVAAKFVEKLKADGMHLRTGFLGTPWLLPALSAIGRDDLAMQLLENKDYPSWGYEVSMGATTVWERWNSIRADGQFGPVEMNSFNHYAYGAVLDWMYRKLGGVEIVEAGFRGVRLHPCVWAGGPASSTCSVETPYGLLRCAWKKDGKKIRYDLTIPLGCTADFVLRDGLSPEQKLVEVRGATGTPKGQDGSLRLTNGCYVVETEIE